MSASKRAGDSVSEQQMDRPRRRAWSVTPLALDPHFRILDATHAMAQDNAGQPHLSEVELGPDIKSILEDISRDLESNWDQGTRELQFVTSYDNIRDLMLKLIDLQEVSLSFESNA